MSDNRESRSSDLDVKVWDPVYSSNRTFFEEATSYVERKRELNAVGDDINLFLRDSEDAIPSYEIEEVRGYCQDTGLDDLLSSTDTVAQRRTAWVDDRTETNNGGVREYDNPLAAIALYQSLKALV